MLVESPEKGNVMTVPPDSIENFLKKEETCRDLFLKSLSWCTLEDGLE